MMILQSLHRGLLTTPTTGRRTPAGELHRRTERRRRSRRPERGRPDRDQRHPHRFLAFTWTASPAGMGTNGECRTSARSKDWDTDRGFAEAGQLRRDGRVGESASDTAPFSRIEAQAPTPDSPESTFPSPAQQQDPTPSAKSLTTGRLAVSPSRRRLEPCTSATESRRAPCVDIFRSEIRLTSRLTRPREPSKAAAGSRRSAPRTCGHRALRNRRFNSGQRTDRGPRELLRAVFSPPSLAG